MTQVVGDDLVVGSTLRQRTGWSGQCGLSHLAACDGSVPHGLLGGFLGNLPPTNLQGLQFHYVQKGDVTKPLMVFVHGFPEFWYSWRYQLQEFYKDYWVVALDMRGYGDSDKPEGVNSYDIKYLVEDIAQFVKELGEDDKELGECDKELGECDKELGECDKKLRECDIELVECDKEPGRDKFTLVAHDWGGIVAWRFVDTHAHMLNSYIIMDAPRIESWMNMAVSNMQQFRKSWHVLH
uniref:AB hydrolase-1 domain-containing protein n=1 Tax=Timema cristinae TaxID=61476 RepID=A0A7R9DHS3_TIMCR|nr:unnamed protein product [Timema cristinae]